MWASSLALLLPVPTQSRLNLVQVVVSGEEAEEALLAHVPVHARAVPVPVPAVAVSFIYACDSSFFNEHCQICLRQAYIPLIKNPSIQNQGCTCELTRIRAV